MSTDSAFCQLLQRRSLKCAHSIRLVHHQRLFTSHAPYAKLAVDLGGFEHLESSIEARRQFWGKNRRFL